MIRKYSFDLLQTATSLLLLLYFTLLSQDIVFAQPQQFRFTHLNSENGLPHNTVYDVTRDRYGFMWFSTRNGVCRYDGYAFKTYKPTGFTNIDVTDLSQCIEPGPNNTIIFGTGSGMYFIDLDKDSITMRVDFSSIDSTDAYKNNLFNICVSKTLLWIGTGNGLIRYDLLEHTYRYFSGEELLPGFSGTRFWIKSIIEAPDGMLWLTSQGGLVMLNPDNFETTVFNKSQTGGRKVNNDYFSSLTFDTKGRLWAGTLRQGVFCFNFSDSTITNINFTGLTDSSEAFNEVKRLITDHQGNIWCATQYSGLVKINPANGDLQSIRTSGISNFALSSDLISALYEDENNILWIGTYNNGVDRTDSRGSQFTNVPGPGTDSTCFGIKAVECFAEQTVDEIWVGTMKGLFLFNRKNYSCKTFEEVTGNKIPLPHSSIVGLIASENELWIGTRANTIVRVDWKTQTHKIYLPETVEFLPKLKSNLMFMLQSEAGKLFFAYTGGVVFYNPVTDKLEPVMDKDRLLKDTERIMRLYEDRKGNLFIMSDHSGVQVLESKTNTLITLSSPNPENDRLQHNPKVLQLNDTKYILTTYKGVYTLNETFEFTNHLNDKHGLSDNKISGIESDEAGKVWLATFNGLSSFDPFSSVFRNYFIQDGLLDNEFREAKSLRASDGAIFFPTNKGFTLFNPAGIRNIKNISSVFFTGFKIGGIDKTFPENLNTIKRINIPAGVNYFSIAFASMAFNTTQPSVFVYKLEGIDADWIISENYNWANYTNIPGGKYLFRVKLLDELSEEKTIMIHVKTIFYKSWWFRGLLFITLGLLIYSLFRFREKQIEKRESLKIIDYFANSFYGRNSVEEILWDVCRNCISRLGFEDAIVYLVEQDRNVLVQKAAYGPKNPRDFEIAHPLEIPIGIGIVGFVAQSGVPEIIPDTKRDPRYIADDDKRQSEIAVPIIYQDKVIGVIDSEHSRKHFFTQEHLRILTTIASICSTKIAKAQSDVAAYDRERKLLEIGKKVAETRLMALRAQMNPHFIFNSLNSIQECIVNQKVEEAHTYLSRFSRLLRMVIDYSEKNFISLEKEIEFLNLYLGLESLRFGKSFNYRIEVAENLDAEETMIPSLLIQPFAENAVWHGLLHKPGDRELLIAFKNKNDEQLLCIIEDNGIGRKKANEIKAGKFDAQHHESKGMQISQERIDLVSIQTDYNTEIVVEDLYDNSGNALGTRVTVSLPLEM